MDKRGGPTDHERLKLRRHIERIRKLCLDVLEGYTSHCQKMYGHPAKQRSLDKIRLLYEQRIERRCADFNLTIMEEKQWDPSNFKTDPDDDVYSSGEESEEHDSDVVNIYTSSSEEDGGSSDEDPVLEPVLRERAYKGFLSGESYDSYNPDNLLDVSVPSDAEGKQAFLSECTLDAYNKRKTHNREYSLGLDWAEYEAFGRKVMMDERIRKMKFDRLNQLEKRAYEASLTKEDKDEFWDIHHWYQSLSEEEKRAEVNLKKTPAEIRAEMSKRRKMS